MLHRLPRPLLLARLAAVALAGVSLAGAAGPAELHAPGGGTSTLLLQPSDPQIAAEWVWPLSLSRLDLAWDITTGAAPGPLIAVIDSGVAGTADLGPRLEGGTSFVGGAATEDPFGHGTLVAGVIAGAGNNGVGVAGVCWSCRVLPLRVIGSDGFALNTVIAQAIDEAVQRGARVINISLGSNDDVAEERAAVERALAAGVVVVAAAGNNGAAALTYPAAYPGVVSVGATDQNGTLSGFSNRGDWVGLLAPECGAALSTSNAPSWLCGTSAASPLVAGLAGLILSISPAATSADIARALQETARPTAGAVHGLVDARAALARFGSAPIPASTTPQDLGSAGSVSVISPALSPQSTEGTSPVATQGFVITERLAASPPQNVQPPVIRGNGTVGVKLSASSGKWAGSPKRVKIRWERCAAEGSYCVVVKRAQATYRVTRADAGKRLRVMITAVAANGKGAKIISRALQIHKPRATKP